jgi:hypothetical protein
VPLHRRVSANPFINTGMRGPYLGYGNRSYGYVCATHDRAIVWLGKEDQNLRMPGMRNYWRRSDRGEKLPLLVLCLCVAVLLSLLLFRPL